jgi:hypothetical protein
LRSGRIGGYTPTVDLLRDAICQRFDVDEGALGRNHRVYPRLAELKMLRRCVIDTLVGRPPAFGILLLSTSVRRRVPVHNSPISQQNSLSN